MKITSLIVAVCATIATPLIFAQSARAQAAKGWGAPESFAVVNPAKRSPLSKVISLDGEWDFQENFAAY
ncbi:MAG: hypothetical protein HUK22_04625, partial [Thermoguttaceae bacterium]|nr:hypothetical protein [Thermoguttaceae bacterium]